MLKFPVKLKKILASKVFCIGLFIMMMLFFVFYSLHLLNFGYNNNWSSYLGIVAENGEFDFSGVDLQEVESSIALRGDWEFYYNKWIITEEDGDEPDGLIFLPSRWTGMRFNGGEPLSGEGFASYALTLQNVDEGQIISVYVGKCDVPYRIFANGTLITTYGTTSKIKSETRIAYDYETPNTYVASQKEDVYIVIETGNAGFGGINDGIVVAMQGEGSRAARRFYINYSPMFYVGVGMSFMIINLVMVFSLFGKKKEWTVVAFLLSVFFHYLFSKSIFFVLLRFFGQALPAIFYILNMLSGCLMFISFLWHVGYEKIIGFSKRTQIILTAVVAAIYFAYYLMTGSIWQAVPFILLFGVMAAILYRMMRAMLQRVRFAFAYTLFLTISMVVFIFEGMDFWSGVSFGSNEACTLLMISTMMIMSVVYFVRMRQNTVSAMKSIQLEKDYTDMRHSAMLAQIKPHFVFNSLTSIQNMYHQSLDEGDTALNYFSKHLRSNIESDIRELIPFEDEILNINNYFMLENMRLENKLTLLFDIEYFDFKVPILSLQPLVENAIKYAKTELKENGYIQIVSKLENNCIVITIKDNGIGFDTSEIKPSSKGLANIAERFKYCLNAEIAINSELGEGASVSILIPTLIK